MPGRWTRVLVVDDYELVRLGLRRALERERWFQVVAECPGVLGTVERALAVRPDVALVSDDLPGADAAELVRDLLRAVPALRVLVLSEYPTRRGLERAVAAGAQGYVRKRRAAEGIVEQVRQVVRGRPGALDAPAGGGGAELALGGLPGVLGELTQRELDVLRLVADGRSNAEIAVALGVSEKTVKNRVTGIFAILGVRRRTQAALLYRELSARS